MKRNRDCSMRWVLSIALLVCAVNTAAVVRAEIIEFVPSDDAFTQNGANNNATVLRVEAGSRVRIIYLKFDLSELPQGTQIQSATLVLQEATDTGSGPIVCSSGLHNDWNEATVTGQTAPAAVGELDRFEGAVTDQFVLNFDVSGFVAGPGIYSFVVSSGAAANEDVAFASKEYLGDEQGPKLVLDAMLGGPVPIHPLPLPDPGGTNIPADITFEWGYIGKAIVNSYTLYMDTNRDIVAGPNEPSGSMLIDGTGDATGIPPAGENDPTGWYVYSGIEKDKVYYWRVVADVQEPNSTDPNILEPAVVSGPVWSFSSLTTGPEVDAGDSVITWLEGGQANLQVDAVVVDPTNDLKSVLWSVIGSPIGSTVTISDLTITHPAITLDMTGTYLLELYAEDEAGNTAADLLEITVYADSCEAAKQVPPGGYEPLPFDFNNDCVQDLEDFAIFAASWLEDRSLTEDLPYSTPQSPSVPVVSFTWPADGATISGIPANPVGEGPINAVAYDVFDATKTDGTRIANVVFQLINSESQIAGQQVENIAPYDWAALDTTQHADGVYTLRAIATGTTTPAYKSQVDVSITIDNTP